MVSRDHDKNSRNNSIKNANIISKEMPVLYETDYEIDNFKKKILNIKLFHNVSKKESLTSLLINFYSFSLSQLTALPNWSAGWIAVYLAFQADRHPLDDRNSKTR